MNAPLPPTIKMISRVLLDLENLGKKVGQGGAAGRSQKRTSGCADWDSSLLVIRSQSGIREARGSYTERAREFTPLRCRWELRRNSKRSKG